MYGLSTIRALNNDKHQTGTTIWKSRHTGRYWYAPTDSWFDTLQEATVITRINFTNIQYIGGK
jgi:hypothetical protein